MNFKVYIFLGWFEIVLLEFGKVLVFCIIEEVLKILFRKIFICILMIGI